MSGPFGYSPAIPQATDIIAQSQPQLLQNAGSIMSIIDVNHGDFATTVAGQHNYVQMYLQLAAPALLAGEVGLFNLNVAGNNEMVVRKSDTKDVPMTKSNQAQPGYTYLPSGIILQWGLATSALPNPYLVAPGFPIPFTVPPFAIFVTPAVSSATDPDSAFTVIAAGLDGPTINSFKVMVNRRSSSSGATQNTRQFYWLAIGK